MSPLDTDFKERLIDVALKETPFLNLFRMLHFSAAGCIQWTHELNRWPDRRDLPSRMRVSLRAF